MHAPAHKDFITTQDWPLPDLLALVKRAMRLKHQNATDSVVSSLSKKTLFMLFFDPSTRTRSSLEAGMTLLGGHAQFIDASSTRFLEGEDPREIAQVYSQYGHAIGIRYTGEGESIPYGAANRLIRTFAKHASIPVINLGDDMFHPCQGLSDMMTVLEEVTNPRNLKFTITWAPAPIDRSLYSVNETLLIMSRLGMDITVAHPEGFELDPELLRLANKNASLSRGTVAVTTNREEALAGANFVFPRNWVSCRGSLQQDVQESWTITSEDFERMAPDARLMHVMPIFREHEATSDVIDSPRSIIIKQAQNRLYAQMALMECLTSTCRSSLEDHETFASPFS